jgi:hypothetical protein
MKKAILFWVVAVFAAVFVFFSAMEKAYYKNFIKNADEMKAISGVQDGTLIIDRDLKGLPDTVQRYLRYAGVVGKKKISSARLYHSGQFRPSGVPKWLPIKGEYFYTTNKPGFIWYGRIMMLPVFPVAAVDTYFDGRGSMEIKALSVFNAGRASGKETDISSFGRLISEMPMIPTVFLDKKTVSWEKIDFETARAIVSDNAMGWSADFTFAPEGPIQKVEVKRFMEAKEGYKLETFTGNYGGWKDFGGYMLPSELDGSWDMPKGPLDYVKFKVDSVIFE